MHSDPFPMTNSALPVAPWLGGKRRLVSKIVTEISKMFARFNMAQVKVRYSVSKTCKSRLSSELIIANFDLSPFQINGVTNAS